MLDTNKDGKLTETDDPYGPYYPGDAYVDWVGLSFYHWGYDRGVNQLPWTGKWGHALGVSNAIPNFHQVLAAGHGKPMLIAETSAFYDSLNTKSGQVSETAIKQNWIQQVYNLTDATQPRLDLAFPAGNQLFVEQLDRPGWAKLCPTNGRPPSHAGYRHRTLRKRKNVAIPQREPQRFLFRRRLTKPR